MSPVVKATRVANAHAVVHVLKLRCGHMKPHGGVIIPKWAECPKGCAK